jgi:hypothetical protein
LSDKGFLGEESVVLVWDSLYHTIETALYDEAARWGDYRRDVHRWQTKGRLYTVDEAYMTERNRLLNEYFPYRSAQVLGDIRQLVESGIIHHTPTTPEADGSLYNLHGQRILRPSKGIYIRNGRKYYQ